MIRRGRNHRGDFCVILVEIDAQLMQAILHDRLPIADIVNATIIPLEQAAEGYKSFDSGVAKKFVLDPHAMLAS